MGPSASRLEHHSRRSRRIQKDGYGPYAMTRRKAFSLIELMVVIAIIGILAAIIFPAYVRVKEQAFRSSDMTNMGAIRTSLDLYKSDQGGYPPTLLGYATGYSNFVPSASDIIPANLVVGALYPKRIDSLETLRPALDKPNPPRLNQFTTAMWPTKEATGSGDPKSYQRFGPGDGPNGGNVSRCVAGVATPVANWYYKVSGYDVSEVPLPNGDTRTELRYTLFWTGYTVPSGCSPSDATGSSADEPRQLGYAEPPETTVVTWDTYFRQYDAAGNPSTAKRDVVLFLGGGVKSASSLSVGRQSFRVLP